MHSISVSVRLMALLAVAIVAVLAFASLSPGTQRQTAQAAAVTTIPPSIVCTDFWLGAKDLANPDTLRVAVAMSRIEPSQTSPGDYDVITALYIGPDQKEHDPDDPNGPTDNLVPDVPPTLELCNKDYDDGLAGAEANQMHPFQPFEGRSNNRPGTQVGFPAVLTKADGESHLIYSTCAFDEVNKQWVRIDTDLNLTAGTAPGTKSIPPAGAGGEIVATLYLGTDAPSLANTKDTNGDGKPDVAIDPLQDPGGCTLSGTAFIDYTPFPSQGDTIFRHVTTDFPGGAKNGGLAVDADTGSALDSADGVADDWDGDGCTDWDELNKDFDDTGVGAGRDPFNPNDCDQNYTGAYSALATVQAATEGVGGSYFHALIAIEHNKTTNVLTGALQVYLDSALLDAGGPPTTVPSGIDGNPGAPPPPPFTTTAPDAVNGVFDKINNLLIFDFCVAGISGLFAPNAIAHAEVDATTLKGTVDISGNQTQAACASKTRNTSSGIQLPGIELVLVQQGLNQNHDKDKCTDMEELLGTGPATCGDDPYNPHDSDENFSSVGNLLVTVCAPPGLPTGICGADWDKTLNQIIPGAYFNCITDIQHDKSDNSLVARAFCYIDSTTTLINPEAYPGEFGDGIAGAGPPWPSTAAQPGGVWADVEPNVFTLTGAYDPVAHELTLEGCFADKDSAGALGNIYTVATINSGTGQGTVEITIFVDAADCLSGLPLSSGVPFPLSEIAVVEQANKDGNGAGYDTDRDGCSDKEELGDNQVLGGLRDPYKYWDFFDPTQNRAIGFTDFLALVSRSGTVDFNATAAINRYTNPLADAPTGIYHPRFDRGGQQTGSNGWNEKPPNGAIGFTDFLSLVRQSGHTCRTEPNDPKYPYPVS